MAVSADIPARAGRDGRPGQGGRDGRGGLADRAGKTSQASKPYQSRQSGQAGQIGQVKQTGQAKQTSRANPTARRLDQPSPKAPQPREVQPVSESWSPQEIETLRQIAPGRTYIELAYMLNGLYGTSRTPSSVKGAVFRNGIPRKLSGPYAGSATPYKNRFMEVVDIAHDAIEGLSSFAPVCSAELRRRLACCCRTAAQEDLEQDSFRPCPSPKQPSFQPRP